MAKAETVLKQEKGNKRAAGGKGISEQGQASPGRVWWEPLLLVVLFWYPLRHIQWGLDFWDTGYNYANFVYMGLEHMDPMWLFSTYLANAVGHFLTKLPGAGGLVGMNLYTGMFVSALAILGYWFCTRKLGISRGIAFVGELAAVSLCWCPTAKLYDYLTYVLFLLCVIFLYVGLTKERMWYLSAAGICLGANVLTRFSNLPEMALIAAVWVYAFLAAFEEGRPAGAGGCCKMSSPDRECREKQGGRDGRGGRGRGRIKRGFGLALRYTLWCLGGYLGALGVLFCYIHIRYGLGNYIAGIRRLFAMTDSATDYKAASMLEGLVSDYVENLYWAKRIGLIVLAGMAGFALAGCILRRCKGKTGAGKREKTMEETMEGTIEETMEGTIEKAMEETAAESKAERLVWGLLRVGFGAVAVLMLCWLYYRGFCSLDYHTYGPIRRPGVLFLMLAMGTAAVRIFHPKSAKEEKLLGGLMILVVLLTSIGSNNKTFPSLNNLFVVGPYTLWQCWRFVRYAKDWRPWISAFPLKAVLAAFLAMFLFQSALFGSGFVFAEATGVRNVTAVIDNNEVLKGVRMSPERAEWMSEISAYVKENNLQGREVILYGWIPSMSYYLQMPSAFNPWSELASFGYEVMKGDLEELAEELEQQKTERPVILMDREYYLYMTGGTELLEAEKVDQSRIDKMAADDAKIQLIKGFAEKFHYDLTFENGKFVVLE